MSHLSGRCDCGRVIHFPKGASYGDTWTCYNCGKTWHIAHHGDPLHSRRSKEPPSGDYSSGGTGCLVPILLIGALILAGSALT